jgi:hypothetical protein
MSGSSVVSHILAGAGSGAALGSVVPGIGTAAGAIGGGLIAGGAELFDYLTSQGMPPAQAQQIAFQAQQTNLPQTDFGDVLRQAQSGALAGNAQASATGAQQGSFADYLRQMQAGNGPSLARMQLDDALEQNTKGAASAIASQRGINPALATRLVMNQRAAADQDAAFRASQLRAQEQLAATGMLGQALGQQRGQDIGQMQANSALYGTATQGQQGQNALSLQNSTETQRINAGIATQNAQNALEAQRINAGAQAQDKANDAAMTGGLLNGAGGALAHMATQPAQPTAPAQPANPDGMATGGVVPGHARVPGDSPRNDTVPAMLTPGEVVIPRSIAQAPDAPDRTAAFVAALKADEEQRARATMPPTSYGHVLARRRMLEDQIRALDAQMGAGR